MPKRITPHDARQYYERTKMNQDQKEDRIDKMDARVNKHITFAPAINKDKRSLSARRTYDRPWA